MATKKAPAHHAETRTRNAGRLDDDEIPVSSHRREVSSSPYSLSSVLQFANNNFLLLVAGIALFVFGFGTGSLWTENRAFKNGGLGQQAVAPQAPAAAPPEGQPLSDADWAEITKDPVFVIGDKNAKLTMVEFTDYQCPFCGRYYTDAHKQIMDNYVKTGKMKIVMRDQALPFHPNANSAAQAVRCAVEQGKAEAMHDQLFTTQDQWSTLSGDAVLAKYSELATNAGMNGQRLSDCVKSGKHKAKVDSDSALGSRVGAGGTPTFFIDKTPLVGAQPFTAFDAVIAQKLGGNPGLPNAGMGGN